MIHLTKDALKKWHKDIGGESIESLKAVFLESEFNYNQAGGWLLPLHLINYRGVQVASIFSLIGCDKSVEFSVENIY